MIMSVLMSRTRLRIARSAFRPGSTIVSAIATMQPTRATVRCPPDNATHVETIASPAIPDCSSWRLSREDRVISSLLLDMLARVVQQPDHVVIVEGVKRHPPAPPRTNEPRATQEPQLMRNGRLTEADERRKVADTALAMRERVEQPHAGWISEQFEDIGDGLDSAFRQQSRTRFSQCGRIRCVKLPAGVVGDLGHTALYEQLLRYQNGWLFRGCDGSHQC